MESPRDQFKKLCDEKETGMVIATPNHRFHLSEYLHPTTHVCWDGKDPHWPAELYAKRWTLLPWDQTKRDLTAPGEQIPIKVQIAIRDHKGNKRVSERDLYGTEYIVDLEEKRCWTFGHHGGAEFCLMYHPVSNPDWKTTDLWVLR